MLRRLTYKMAPDYPQSISSQVLGQLKSTCEINAGLGPLWFNPEPRPGRWEQVIQTTQSEIQTQMLKFFIKGTHIYEELGPWAADYFVLETVSVLRARSLIRTDILLQGNDVTTLLRLLDRECFSEERRNAAMQALVIVSPKVDCLLSYLAGIEHKECSGIVFVQQRVTASVLSTLLSTHPSTKDRFRCATFVGMSNNGARKCTVAELVDVKAQRETLSEFRARRKDLIIATDALEEGIDVSACNLVVCFSPPSNLKSFIQRRGRARKEASQYVIMFSEDAKKNKLDMWRSLEDKLIQAYQSDMREAELSASVEAEEEEILEELRSTE